MIKDLKYSTNLKECNRNDFDCGISALNAYLQNQASQDVKKGLAICYVAKLEREVVGFYTLSQHLIERDEFPNRLKKKIPQTYNAPATLIGRFAVDKKFQGKSCGKMLLMHALYKIYIGSQNSGTYGAVVVAKEESEQFYVKQGFIVLNREEKKYFLPIKVIENSIPDELKVG